MNDHLSLQARLTQVLRVIDEMFRRLELWISTPQHQPVMPRDVEAGIVLADETCTTLADGLKIDELVIAISKLHGQFELYNAHTHGHYQPDGSPGPKFWAVAREARIARFNAERRSTMQREPIASLRKSGVSDMQIASAIYGYRGAGPFMAPDGTPDVALLDQEEKNPGSVWKNDYVPPWEMDSYNARKKALEDKIAGYRKLEEGAQGEYPLSVKELLQDGAYIQQIMRVKKVSRSEVLEVARLNKLAAVDGPGYVPDQFDNSDDQDDEFEGDDTGDDGVDGDGADDEPIPVGEAEEKPTPIAPKTPGKRGRPRKPAPQENHQQPSDGSDRTARNSQDAANSSMTSAQEMAVQLFAESNQSMGADEIARKLRDQGHQISVKSVAASISQWKRRNREAQAAG